MQGIGESEEIEEVKEKRKTARRANERN